MTSSWLSPIHTDSILFDYLWRSRRLMDVFDMDGRYPGPVDIPDGEYESVHILYTLEDFVLFQVQDEAGVYHIKHYRLQLPDSGMN